MARSSVGRKRRTVNANVVGSSPTGPAKKFARIISLYQSGLLSLRQAKLLVREDSILEPVDPKNPTKIKLRKRFKNERVRKRRND